MPTVLVTGASRGLGLEFCRQYAAAGWRVHAVTRHAAAPALQELAGDVQVHAADIGDPAQVAALAGALRGEAIDLLLNNAGANVAGHTSLGDMDYAAWENVLRVNVLAPFRVAEAFVEHVARSRKRIMLFVSTRAGSIHDVLSGGRYVYRSSKAALNMVVKAMALELMPRRILCVAVHPGWVRTDMGGQDAPIGAEFSVASLRALVERLETHHSGRFLNYDGTELHW
jgi:NAD(P)-dependent dehydrogenase (short-subunit alcohol dehydrogenase family)